MCDAAERIYTQGVELGKEQGKALEKRNTASRLYKKGNRVADIAEILDVSERQIEEWLGLQPA